MSSGCFINSNWLIFAFSAFCSSPCFCRVIFLSNSDVCSSKCFWFHTVCSYAAFWSAILFDTLRYSAMLLSVILYSVIIYSACNSIIFSICRFYNSFPITAFWFLTSVHRFISDYSEFYEYSSAIHTSYWALHPVSPLDIIFRFNLQEVFCIYFLHLLSAFAFWFCILYSVFLFSFLLLDFTWTKLSYFHLMSLSYNILTPFDSHSLLSNSHLFTPNLCSCSCSCSCSW
jgi:hypothetical protein